MQIILTHEQADFDALASLVGAALLAENALAVMPRKANRNVRAYLNLYSTGLNLLEQNEIPAGPIEQVTLVDTQSLVTLKGIGRHTEIRVVDHHTRRGDLPEGWLFEGERLGACTTLFVEKIRQEALPLEVNQATLLLLGIYEDTGSLTYAGTTARDVQAAAYLLEQGANLRIAAKYLNPPLSNEQRALYDALLSSAQSVHINGQNVILAKARAVGLVDEISSVAHKLRDLLDPDALFLLVETGEGVRLVARSTSDRINVAEVAAQFGGGGHERAAAALIPAGRSAEPGDPLEAAAAKLTAMLPGIVRPSIAVGQIMSKKPLLLNEETSAEKAFQLMQRYGYEGYPVVKNGKVAGLLTRRAVDRAMQHKLNLPVSSLMTPGEVVIQSTDSLESLQKLMAESGWGQVPVVHPDTGEIIGIVTRTDLLKVLARSDVVPGRLNLAERLEAALPPARLALLRLVADRARAMRVPVYIVGGFVRDILLDRPSLDFDIVVEGDAIALARDLSAAYGGRMVSHSRFGTASWETSQITARQLGLAAGLDSADLPERLDLISARTEFYDYPSALPTVERSSIKLDLHRRDFTINTMALRLDGRHYGNLYDYWGGLDDLRRGIVRVLHSLSFVDDPTRMLRAVRFEQRFQFKIDPRTLELMVEGEGLLRQVSGDRLRHELNLILLEADPLPALARLEELNLLYYIQPGLIWQERFAPAVLSALTLNPHPQLGLPAGTTLTETRLSTAYLCWLAHLPESDAWAVFRRLKISGLLRESFSGLLKLHREIPAAVRWPPSRAVRFLDPLPRLSLYAALCFYREGAEADWLRAYLDHWRAVQPTLNGRDLIRRGLTPGPSFGHVLGELRGAWLDGRIHSPEEETALLDSLLSQMASNQNEEAAWTRSPNPKQPG